MNATVNGLTSRTRSQSTPRRWKYCGQSPGVVAHARAVDHDVERLAHLLSREQRQGTRDGCAGGGTDERGRRGKDRS
jgi:hypothetical protein